MRASRFYALCLVSALAGGGWYYWTASAREQQAAKPGTAEAAKTPAARPASPIIAVLAASVEISDFVLRRRTIGFAEPVASVGIKSRLDSQIVEQRVKDGQMVREGDVLFVLDDRELKAQIAKDEATLARDKAILERTRADLARKRDLLTRNAATPQQVDLAVSDEQSAAATVRSDEATLTLSRLRLGYTEIKAPITGRVGAVSASVGNLIKANDATPLITITQVSPIRVSFPISERDLPSIQAALKAGTPPQVRTFSAGTSTPLAIGKVDFLDSSVDMTSGTIEVKAIFDNSETTLWPGQYLDVDVVLSRIEQAAIVPTIAVQPGQNGAYVFVITPDQTVEIRPVIVAATEGERTAITKGLAAGERVVTDGQMRLINGARVRDQGAGDAARKVSASDTPVKQP